MFQDMTEAAADVDDDDIMERVIDAQESVLAIPGGWARAVEANGLDAMDEENLPHRVAASKLEELESSVLRRVTDPTTRRAAQRLLSTVSLMQTRLDDDEIFNNIFGHLENST